MTTADNITIQISDEYTYDAQPDPVEFYEICNFCDDSHE